MRRTDAVKRSHEAAKAALAKHASVEQQRDWYNEELDQTIGPRFAASHGDDGKPVGALALLSTPTAIIALAIVTFTLTFLVLIWRDGALDGAWKHVVANSGYAPKAAGKPWLLGGDNGGPAKPDRPAEAPAATIEQPNEMEAALQAARIAAQPPPPPPEPIVEAEATAP